MFIIILIRTAKRNSGAANAISLSSTTKSTSKGCCYPFLLKLTFGFPKVLSRGTYSAGALINLIQESDKHINKKVCNKSQNKISNTTKLMKMLS